MFLCLVYNLKRKGIMVFKDKNSRILYNVANVSAWGLLIAMLGFMAWTIFFTETGNGDNVEHIHATWLIATGKVPYRDFFQHHHPLLWYMFAPFIKSVPNVMLMLDMAHAIALITGVLAFFTVYKICTKFFASSLASLCSLLILCPTYYYIFCFNFNPDTFMTLFFALGLYFLLVYWDKKQLYALCLAFFVFFIAFLFTQKTLSVVSVLGIIFLYMCYKQKTPLSHVFYALLVPVLCTILGLVILYKADMLDIYWRSNYVFNVVMQKYYGYDRVGVMDHEWFFFSCTIACCCIFWCFKNQNIFYKIISVLFVTELLQRCFYFSIAPYYLLPLMIYTCILNSVFIDKIMQKQFAIIFALLGVGVYYLCISKSNYLDDRGQDRSFTRYISNYVNHCDYVISAYLSNQTIANKDPHYYWSILGHVDMVGEEIGAGAHPNLNDVVLKYKPKLVYGGDYFSSYHQNRGQEVFLQHVSPQILDEYYLPTPFDDFYLLKYEYQKKDCRYDKNKGDWYYAD